jgi:hypothetical protein
VGVGIVSHLVPRFHGRKETKKGKKEKEGEVRKNTPKGNKKKKKKKESTRLSVY